MLGILGDSCGRLSLPPTAKARSFPLPGRVIDGSSLHHILIPYATRAILPFRARRGKCHLVSTLDRAFDAGTMRPTPKRQHSGSLRAKDDVLFIYSAFQSSVLAWASVMTGYDAPLFNYLRDLRTVLAVGAFRVDRPVAGAVGGLLLGGRDIASDKEHGSEEQRDQLGFVIPYAIFIPRRSVLGWGGARRFLSVKAVESSRCGYRLDRSRCR
jgi:hypothetical protein